MSEKTDATTKSSIAPSTKMDSGENRFNLFSIINPSLVSLKLVENDLVDGSSILTSDRWIHSKLWLCGLVTSIPVLIISVIIAYILWFTDIYKYEVLKAAVLKEGNELYETWKNPPLANIVSFYTFNYTNIDAMLKGEEKPRVSELGPYVFKEYTKRENIVIHDNGTLTFQDFRYHEFIPELTVGDWDDEIFVPNIPLISAIAEKPKVLPFMQKTGLRLLLAGLQPEPFQKMTVDNFAWGYDDSFSIFSRNLAKILKRPIPSNFGMLAERDGLSEDRITMGTGTQNLENLGIVSHLNGKEHLGIWESEECDNLTGSDGTIYAGSTLSRNSKLYLFAKNFCRRLPLVYKEDSVSSDGFPTYRFVFRKDMLASPDINPENLCFCNETSCLPSGAFHVGKCMFGAPIVFSLPHFLNSEGYYQDKVDGLKPDPELHETYIDIDQVVGLPLNSQVRIQFNILIHNDFLLPVYKGIESGTVLPLVWMDFGVENLTEDLHDLLYKITYPPKVVELVFRWGSLILILFSLFLIFYIIKSKLKILHYRK